MKNDTLLLKELMTGPAVERGADGVPVAFRLLKPGRTVITQDGKRFALELSDAKLGEIMNWHTQKGAMIPLDAEHYLAKLANEKGIDEADLLATDPKLGEKAGNGLLSLERRADGSIWAKIEKLAERARELLSGSGTKLVGYFSPTLRGLAKGPLRISSVALTNDPAIDGLDTLAATDSGLLQPINPNKDKTPMKNWIKRLAGLLGLDVATLSDDSGDVIAERAAVALERHGAAHKQMADSLKLTDAATPELLAGKVAALATKAEADALALADATTKLAAHDAAAKTRLLDGLEKDGKLTPALRAKFDKLDIATLSDLAKDLPVIVPGGTVVKPGDKASDDGSLLALSDLEISAAKAVGITDLPAYAKRIGRSYTAPAKAG